MQRKSAALDRVIEPGNAGKTNEAQQFIAKAAGSKLLSREYDILFNLLLVKYGARPAYLLEGANFEPIEAYAAEIKRLYPEFHQTVEYIVDNRTARILIHSAKLPAPVRPRRGRYDSEQPDIWLAENLGFYCKGIAPDDVDRVSIHYFLMIEGDDSFNNLYSEICSLDKFSRHHFDEKLNSFQAVAQLIPGWQVEMRIEPMRADPLQDWAIQLLDNDEFSFDETRELLQYLYGWNIPFLGENIENDKYAFDDLRRNKKLLLFMVSWAIFLPFKDFYGPEYESAIAAAEAQGFFTSLNQDFKQQYQQFEQMPQIQQLLASRPDAYNSYLTLKQEMLDNYDDLVSQLK